MIEDDLGRPIIRPERVKGETIQERFESFHRLNPHVERVLVHFARQMRARGRRKLGIALLWERMRWEFLLRTRGDHAKLPNEYRSRYSRMIMANESDLDGFFTTKGLRSP